LGSTLLEINLVRSDFYIVFGVFMQDFGNNFVTFSDFLLELRDKAELGPIKIYLIFKP
jgi:hypothetical protein